MAVRLTVATVLPSLSGTSAVFKGGRHHLRRALPAIVTATLLSAGFTACSTVSHSTLAVTFAGLTVITLTLPPLTIARKGALAGLAVWSVSVAGVAGVWLMIGISWLQWIECASVAGAYALSLMAVAALLQRTGVPGIVSAATVMIAALAWLAWPVWLSPALVGHQTAVNALVLTHPLLAINGVLVDWGIWTERPCMYGWTALSQDVPYSMPQNVAWCVLLHLGIAAVALLALCARFVRQRRS
jgi:hypothetical protein